MHKYINKNILKKKNQAGAATLIVTVILLIGITLISLFAAKVGILDQKISGNEYRHKEAFSNAEAGLEQAASYLRANPSLHDATTAGWESCAGFTNFPCDIADFVFVPSGASTVSASLPVLTSSASAYLTKTSADLSKTIALGQGRTADGTGAAVAQVTYAKSSLFTPGQIPPLMTPSAELNGTFTIVPDPNGGGPEVPISAWVKEIDYTKNTGTWQTCNHGEFRSGGSVCMDTLDDTVTWKDCKCTEDKSNKTVLASGEAYDIAVGGANFPYSPFAYVFNRTLLGTTNAEKNDEVAELKDEIKSLADVKGIILSDCSTLPSLDLATLDMPLVWVEGDCNLPSNNVFGSRDVPIILIVEGDLKVNANTELWGIMFGFGVFSMNGGAVIHGSAIGEISSELTNGGYSQIYDESVLEALKDDALTVDISKLKYSWRDF